MLFVVLWKTRYNVQISNWKWSKDDFVVNFSFFSICNTKDVKFDILSYWKIDSRKLNYPSLYSIWGRDFKKQVEVEIVYKTRVIWIMLSIDKKNYICLIWALTSLNSFIRRNQFWPKFLSRFETSICCKENQTPREKNWLNIRHRKNNMIPYFLVNELFSYALR